MPKLTIEVEGNNSINTKIFVNGEQIYTIQKFNLTANAQNGLLEMTASFPKFTDFDLPQNSIIKQVPLMIELLESCGVKCNLENLDIT